VSSQRTIDPTNAGASLRLLAPRSATALRLRIDHDVTLCAAPGSSSTAHVHTLLEKPHPDGIGSALDESDLVACAWAQVEQAAARGRPFDVLHDHSGFTALAMADRVGVPVVHTIHGPVDRHTTRFYQRHGRTATLVAISRTQAASVPAGECGSARWSPTQSRSTAGR
jgi:Glycosyltransferase Family 4